MNERTPEEHAPESLQKEIMEAASRMRDVSMQNVGPVAPKTAQDFSAGVAVPSKNDFKAAVSLFELKADELPSGGLSYGPSFKLTYRKYDYLEMETINRSSLSYESLTELYMQGVSLHANGKDDKFSLAASDLDYILAMRKLRSLGVESNYSLEQVCPVCSKLIVNKTNLSQISYPSLADKGVTSLPAIVTMSDGRELKFGLFTVRDMIDSLRMSVPDAKEKIFTLVRMARNGGTQMSEETLTIYFNSLNDFEDLEALDYLYDVLNPVVDPFKFECEGVLSEEEGKDTRHEKITIELSYEEVSGNILKPFRPEGSAIQRKVRFGS